MNKTTSQAVETLKKQIDKVKITQRNTETKLQFSIKNESYTFYGYVEENHTNILHVLDNNEDLPVEKEYVFSFWEAYAYELNIDVIFWYCQQEDAVTPKGFIQYERHSLSHELVIKSSLTYSKKILTNVLTENNWEKNRQLLEKTNEVLRNYFKKEPTFYHMQDVESIRYQIMSFKSEIELNRDENGFYFYEKTVKKKVDIHSIDQVAELLHFLFKEMKNKYRISYTLSPTKTHFESWIKGFFTHQETIDAIHHHFLRNYSYGEMEEEAAYYDKKLKKMMKNHYRNQMNENDHYLFSFLDEYIYIKRSQKQYTYQFFQKKEKAILYFQDQLNKEIMESDH